MSVEEYLKGVEFRYKYDNRSEKDVIVEYLMTSLRLLNGFKPDHFREATGISIPRELRSRFRRLKDRGLLEYKDGCIKVTDNGLNVFDSIVYEATEIFL